MNEINRKPMKDILVPQQDIMRRPPLVPSAPLGDVLINEPNRIENNPFFEKRRLVRNNIPQTPKEKGSHLFLWTLAVGAVLGAGITITGYFSSATIEVVPLTQNISINHDLTAVKEPLSGELSFQFMSLTEEKTKEVSVVIEKKIQNKASGKVSIYNAYGKEPQRLIKNTRLESSDNKIFRINDSIVVPGAKMLNGKVVEPGVIEALVYADIPGEEYNIGLADFTIPGFKGDPRYVKFTARSVSSAPITGGFLGTVKIPTDNDVADAQKKLKEELKAILIKKTQTQIPEGMSFFPGSIVLKFEEVPQDFSDEKASMVIVRATISAFFFDTVLLTQKIVDASFKEYQNTPLLLSNMSLLSFTFLDPVDKIVLSDIESIRFTIKGEANFVGAINKEKLITEIVGKKKDDFTRVVGTQNSIKKANAVIWPFWKTVFPTDPEKISVKIVTE